MVTRARLWVLGSRTGGTTSPRPAPNLGFLVSLVAIVRVIVTLVVRVVSESTLEKWFVSERCFASTMTRMVSGRV